MLTYSLGNSKEEREDINLAKLPEGSIEVGRGAMRCKGALAQGRRGGRRLANVQDHGRSNQPTMSTKQESSQQMRTTHATMHARAHTLSNNTQTHTLSLSNTHTHTHPLTN